MNLSQLIKKEGFCLLDGALGTELTRRGVRTSLPLWSAEALLTDPAAVYRLHRDYIEAGAEIVTANTFRTNPRAVTRARVNKSARELTLTAVELAQRAITDSGRKVLLAGSMAPVEDCYSPQLVPSDAELQQEHAQLATFLAEAGVDLILVETMNCRREAKITAQAALKTSLPVLVSFTLNSEGQLLSGEKLEDAVATIVPLGISGLLINCLPPRDTLQPLTSLKRLTELPLGVYAHGQGQPDDDQGWRFSGEDPLEDYLAEVRKWVDLGVKIIGGCCGTNPTYISRLDQLRKES